MTSRRGKARMKPAQPNPILTPSAMKALGTSIATVKPRLLKKRAANIGHSAIRQAVPNPSIEKTPTKYSDFQLVIGQKDGKHLNEVHVQLFFETVGDAVLELISCSTLIPAFESCKIRNGQIIITAKNRASRDWLLRHLGKIRPNGAELMVAGPAEIPSSVTYKTGFIWVPTARYSNEEIMQILESQNPELMVSSWKVMGRQPETWGLTLKVDIDSRCIPALKDIDFQPYFVLRRVDVKLLQDLKRKNPSDANIETDMIGPSQRKRKKQQIPAAENSNKSTASVSASSPLSRRRSKTVGRRIEASKFNSTKGIQKHKTEPSARSKSHFPFRRRSGSPTRREMSYSCDQRTGSIPSLLDINATMPNVSQTRTPLFHNSTVDNELSFDDRGNALWNSTITSRELDTAVNSSFYPDERDNFLAEYLEFKRNKLLSSRVRGTVSNGTFPEGVRDSSMFPESRERSLVQTGPLFSRRSESYVGKKFLIANKPILQRSTLSPKNSYHEIDSSPSHPISRLGSSSLICHPNPTDSFESELPFMSSLTKFPPTIESRMDLVVSSSSPICDHETSVMPQGMYLAFLAA
nr:unnamed protein product [Callosobruchus analis]